MEEKAIGVTIGDPAGIGPEICLRVAPRPEVTSVCRPILVGDRCVLEEIRGVAGYDGAIHVYTEKDIGQALSGPAPEEGVELLDTGELENPPPLGKVSAEGGRASHAAIVAAIRAAQAGHLRGVATAPINKLALNMAGIEFIGHTEIFGEQTRSPSFAMLMYSQRLAVGLVTCHQPLATVPGSLEIDRIAEVGRLLSSSIQKIRNAPPRVAVLGLNPHSGEGGLLGREDTEIVLPAVEKLKAEGYDVEGPVPPDTAFTPTALKRYDAHLCLYHDQGLIPFKMISFADGVNVTMGLPFPRTSVDHGTAYDLAGRGKAEITSLIAAIGLAARLA